MNKEIVERYAKGRKPEKISRNGNVEEYGKPNIELLVKLLLKSKYITNVHNK
jgi:hypothetical protein